MLGLYPASSYPETVDDLRRQQRIDAPGILAQVREALAATSEPSEGRSKARAA